MTTLYDSQRSLRHKRRAALQRGLVAILDIGTSKIACFIVQFDQSVQSSAQLGKGVIASHGAFRVIGVATTRSRGVRYGYAGRPCHCVFFRRETALLRRDRRGYGRERQCRRTGYRPRAGCLRRA
jgi:hypothetical protein